MSDLESTGRYLSAVAGATVLPENEYSLHHPWEIEDDVPETPHSLTTPSIVGGGNALGCVYVRPATIGLANVVVTSSAYNYMPNCTAYVDWVERFVANASLVQSDTLPHIVDVASDDLHIGRPRAFQRSAFVLLDALQESRALREANEARHSVSGFGRDIAERLLELVRLTKEEGGELPSPESIRSFVKFLASDEVAKPGGISADREGLIWATWRKSKDCYVALRFYIDGQISYAFVAPPSGRFGKPVHAAGIGRDVDVLHAIGRPSLGWMRQ